MPSILIEIINEGKLDNYLSEVEKSELIELINNIKQQYLYRSPFHGLYHSEKVLLFTYLISRHEALANGEMEIITDAALYHDIGRQNDYEDTLHGFASARLIDKVVSEKSIYQNRKVFNLLQALCDAHSLDDNRRDVTFDTYELPIEWALVYQKLYNILKDADALDRARFGKTTNIALKEKFLRISYSKQLVDLAYKINECYREKISDRFFQKYNNFPREENTICSHGIGCNFAVFDSILEHGILSSDAKKKHKVGISRNFNGNNNDLWISVTVGEGEAKKMFVDNGISFTAITDYLVDGVKDQSKARSEGLPIDSGRYEDEKFAFYEIPLDNIREINVNPDILNQTIDNLYYLNGSRNYDGLVESLDCYLNYLRMKLGYFPNINKIETIKTVYRESLLTFESKPSDSQKAEYSDFFKACDEKVVELNKELQKMIYEAFSLKFKKEKVTLYDVINYILLEKGFDFDYEEGSFKLKTNFSR